MDWIEQVVFTSAETDRSAGYQVVATSPGVPEVDARELAVWGPSHNALLDPGRDAVSYNFHPLPSGAYGVGRTTPAGWEYSGRGGVRVYTQCLVVPPRTLARFANNPFALLRAALAAGVLRTYERVPERLAPLRLAGRAAVVDSALLARLCAKPGPDWLAALVQAALTSAKLAVTGGPPAEHLIAGLINCLPPECRPQFSFSTGLKFSSRRPFRVLALSEDEEEQRRVKRLYDLAVLDLSGPPPAESDPVESWARFIHRALKSGRTSFLANRLTRCQSEFAPEDLPALGLQLLEELDASSLGGDDTDADADAEPDEDVDLDVECAHEEHDENRDHGDNDREDDHEDGREDDDREWIVRMPGSHPADPPEEEPWLLEMLDARLAQHALPEPPDGGDAGPGSDDALQPCPAPSAQAQQHSHEAHDRFQGQRASATDAALGASIPSTGLDADEPETVEKLEHLDDLVYDAIGGKPAALARLKAFWPQVRDAVHEELLDESKDQYLRCALSTWIASIQADSVRDAAQAAQSLEVLCVLFDQL